MHIWNFKAAVEKAVKYIDMNWGKEMRKQKTLSIIIILVNMSDIENCTLISSVMMWDSFWNVIYHCSTFPELGITQVWRYNHCTEKVLKDLNLLLKISDLKPSMEKLYQRAKFMNSFRIHEASLLYFSAVIHITTECQDWYTDRVHYKCKQCPSN